MKRCKPSCNVIQILSNPLFVGIYLWFIIKTYEKMLVLANLVIIAAFTAQPAYVHNGAELNRELSEFLNEITLRENVAICYHKNGATPQLVANLAWNACAEFSNQAVSVV